MKISMKRIAAFVLALVMVIGLVPVVNNTVNAAVSADFSGLTDKSIGVSLKNSTTAATSTWNGSENTITGSLAGYNRAGKLHLMATDTLTITNNKSSKAKLSFDYATSGYFTTGTITIGSEPAIKSATSGSYSVDLAAGGSIDIILDVKQNKTGTNQIGINITNLSLTIVGGSAVDATFEAPAYGSYTVAYGDENVTVAAGTASQVITNMPDVKYTLTANPGEGYKFVGWYNVTTGTYLSTSATFNFSFEEAATVKAVIVPADSAVFLTGGNYYTDLNEAVAYATANSLTQITLVQSGTLAANGTGYTIPAGITLLIPMDADYTPTGFNELGINPEYTLDVVTPYSYVTLTLAEGAALTVNGTVDIESKHTTLQGAANKRIHGGRPSGAYGAIYMSPNSTITLNSGANLYAWGYVYGDGAITANSGAKVYEYMQVTDFPGGGNLSLFVDAALDADGDGDDIYDNDYIKSFPFSQYYVQNIEVALTLMAGATESVFTTVTVQQMSMGMPVEFVGNNGMFVPGTGSITKDYDPSTDRLIVEVNGDATVRGIVMDMSQSPFAGAMEDIIGTSKFDSSRYILTLNSNITINVNSGTTTVAQDMALFPGVEIYVGKNATMRIAERTFADGELNNLTMYGSGGYNVYVYDLDQFQNFVFQNTQMIPVSYSPTAGRYVRTVEDLKDAVIDIDGKLICDGFLYSTVETDPDTFEPVKGGAAIISSGKTGSIVFQNGCGIEEFAFCLDGKSNADNIMEVDSAWLLNGDGSYVKTVCDACASFDDENYDCTHVGQTYNYCSVHDLWYTEGHELCGKAVEITWIINGEDETQEVDYDTVPVYLGNPTKPADGCTVYTFAGWATSANGEVLSELPKATMNAVYYAIFTEGTEHFGDTDNDHFCNGCGDELSDCIDDNKDHECDFAGCDEVLSECVDSNQDHICDYAGCKAATSECKDSNNDHYCDYLGCLDKISECKDDNKDHKCDYAGCGDTLTSCEDANEDHICDYVGCKATTSACKDDNQNHECDYAGCDEILSTCRDINEDHICDYLGCLNPVGECVDNDQDHICDLTNCDKVLSECVDNDKDHKCDYAGCDEVLSDCVDANEDHICDHAGCKATTSTCKDDNEDHKCDYVGCGEKLSDCVDADDKNHNCDYVGCNKPNVDGGCHGGTADCQNKPVCAECGQEYGSKNDSNHTGSVVYTDNKNGTHSAAYDCCGASYVTNEKHQYVNGVCVCENVEHVCADNLTFHEAVTPDCQNGGNSAYYSCSCGKFYADANASSQIAKDSWVLGKDSSNHTGTVGYTDNGADHTAAYSCCGESWNEDHTYVNGTCVCNATAAVSVTMDGITTYHATLNSAIQAVKNSTSKTTVVKLMKDVALGDRYQTISYGVFTFDLGGFTLSNSSEDYGVLNLSGTRLDITITDSGVDGKISGYSYGVEVHGSTVTIEGGTVIGGDTQGLNAHDATLVISGGTIISKDTGMIVYDSTVTISGGSISGDYGVVAHGTSNVTVSGGSISGKSTDIYSGNDATVSLVLGENSVGATFPGGINIGGTTLNAILGEGAAYWQAGKVIIPADNAEKITGGDVVIKGICSHPGDKTYTNNGDDHTYTYTCCGSSVTEGHTYVNGTCVCTAVASYTLTVEIYNGQLVELTVPYGANLKAVLAQAAADGKIPAKGDHIRVNDSWANGEYVITGRYFMFPDYNEVNDDTTMPAETLQLYQDLDTFGWIYVQDGVQYSDPVTGVPAEGWCYIEEDYDDVPGGAWYYFAFKNYSYVRVEGVTRVPYNTELGYGPDAEAMEYCANKGIEFIDANEAWFVFDEDGKFLSNFTGKIGTSYAVNGHLSWHVGLVEIDGDYYYFTGDEVNGGNVMVTGRDYYLSRNNTELDMVTGGIYTYGADGKLCSYEGITEVNGVLRYYENARLMIGNGLTKVGENYIYVDSTGVLIVDAAYYIGGNDFGVNTGVYNFDENGFMVIPEENGWNGLYEVDGTWYYYVNGEKAYCAGLVEIDGKWVYVKSDGSLATGVYYVTNTNGHETIKSGTKCSFDENGFMQEALNGIVDGYYYVDNAIAYGAGLIEIDGIYYYVRSNGQIVKDCQYWITNVNDTGYEPGMYQFDVDGWMSEIYVETFTGIMDGKFYIKDEVAYGAGLMNYNGAYIYVRSNGELATGKYWVTNHNDVLPEGYYDFGENGFYYPELPDDADLLKEYEKDTETDGFSGYYGAAEAVVPSADGYLYIVVKDVTYAEELAEMAGFNVSVDSPDYWAAQFVASKTGTGMITMPVTAGTQYAVFVNPADINGEEFTLINGTITYSIYSDVECEFEEIRVGQ